MCLCIVSLSLESGPNKTRFGGFEAGAYLRLKRFVHHSTLGLRVIKKKKILNRRARRSARPNAATGCTASVAHTHSLSLALSPSRFALSPAHSRALSLSLSPALSLSLSLTHALFLSRSLSLARSHPLPLFRSHTSLMSASPASPPTI